MEGGRDWTILRNGLYAELLAWAAAPDSDGRITAPLGAGQLAAVARQDLADVTARVVIEASAHAGRSYELVGPEAIGGTDLARALTAATGTAVSFEPTTLARARETMTASGAASSPERPVRSPRPACNDALGRRDLDIMHVPYESDLREQLAQHLNLIEPGLRLV